MKACSKPALVALPIVLMGCEEAVCSIRLLYVRIHILYILMLHYILCLSICMEINLLYAHICLSISIYPWLSDYLSTYLSVYNYLCIHLYLRVSVYL